MRPNQFKQTNSLNFPSFPEKEGQIEILIVDNPSQSHDGGCPIHTRIHLGYLHVIVLSQCYVIISQYVSKFSSSIINCHNLVMSNMKMVGPVISLQRWVHLCIAVELRHDWGDADVSPDEIEDIDVIDDPREDICIRECFERLLVGMAYEL